MSRRLEVTTCQEAKRPTIFGLFESFALDSVEDGRGVALSDEAAKAEQTTTKPSLHCHQDSGVSLRALSRSFSHVVI